MKRALLPALLLATPAMAEPWQGIWSADPVWCVNAGQIGSVTPAPIALSATELLGYENSCAIEGVQAMDGLNAWVLGLSCQGEGESYQEDRLVMVDGDTLYMWWGVDAPIRFVRCAG